MCVGVCVGKADTAVIKAIDGKVVIDITVSLKKYLTN